MNVLSLLSSAIGSRVETGVSVSQSAVDDVSVVAGVEELGGSWYSV